MVRCLALALVLTLALLTGCGAGSGQEVTDCDQLWTELEGARDAAQSYTIQRVEGLSDSEINNLPDDPEEVRLHAEVERAYAAWQAAGCG
jgi:hypothetical protein